MLPSSWWTLENILDFAFAGRILQSVIPLTIMARGPPPLELINIIASIARFIGQYIILITALPLLIRIFNNTCSPCPYQSLLGWRFALLAIGWRSYQNSFP